MSGRLTGKIAVVTGGASGIGKATVGRFIEEGATVVLADINKDAGEAVATDLGASFQLLDVTSEENWQSLMAGIDAEHGRLDILVNNAGISPHDSVESLDLDQ